MSTAPEPVKSSKVLIWTGRIISALPVAMLLMSATMKFLKPPEVIKGFADLGYPESLAFGLGVTEVICTTLYIIPMTSVLGAILLTGYLGGAISAHARVGDNFAIVVVLGVLVWLGLFLRDGRIRALIPFKK
jgi:hypothetical protein